MPSSYIDPATGVSYPLDIPRWCSDERRPLMMTEQTGITRDEIERKTRSLWRYRAALPVKIDRPITLGEGCTPLIESNWGDFRPLFKLEWFHSFPVISSRRSRKEPRSDLPCDCAK